MDQILNLTQHDATHDQVLAGVVEPADKSAIRALLTFEELPDANRIQQVAWELAKLANAELRERGTGWPWVEGGGVRPRRAMIGGAPFFMGPLERALRTQGITPLYAFSRREASVDTHRPDGSVGKTQIFRHVGFVEAVL